MSIYRLQRQGESARLSTRANVHQDPVARNWQEKVASCFFCLSAGSRNRHKIIIMKSIDTDFIHIDILDQKTVLVEAVEGVEIDLVKALHANEMIAREMPSDYGMIINRKADYSIVPLDVYNVLNGIPTLKAIAIVVHGKRNFLPINTEKKLFERDLEVFGSIEGARQWLSEVIDQHTDET